LHNGSAILAFIGALLSVSANAAAQNCASPLLPATEIDLFFGRSLAGAGEVSDAEWARFLADEVTPRFPDGLSVIDAAGQYRAPTGRLVHEDSKLLVVVVFDPPAVYGEKVQTIVEAYKRRFDQRSVFRVERSVCAGG
jgi:hypothetical protein